MTIEDTSEFAGVIYYLHTGDFQPRYIGKTTQTLKARFNRHKSNARNGYKRAVYDWMRKHGVENIQVCAIATFDEETIHLIDEVERFHIAQNRSLVEAKTLNHTEGGEGAPGVKASAETRLKLKARPVYTRTDEIRESARMRAHIQWHEKRSLTNPECGYCNE